PPFISFIRDSLDTQSQRLALWRWSTTQYFREKYSLVEPNRIAATSRGGSWFQYRRNEISYRCFRCPCSYDFRLAAARRPHQLRPQLRLAIPLFGLAGRAESPMARRTTCFDIDAGRSDPSRTARNEQDETRQTEQRAH